MKKNRKQQIVGQLAILEQQINQLKRIIEEQAHELRRLLRQLRAGNDSTIERMTRQVGN